MHESNPTMAQRVAQAASDAQYQRSGVVPQLATAVLCDDTLVVTLRGTLSRAEKALAEQSPPCAAQVQEYHRQLFADASESLWQELRRITGAEVREASSQVETTTGTMIQVFLLAEGIPAEIWNR